MPLNTKDKAQVNGYVEHGDCALGQSERLTDGLECGAGEVPRDRESNGLQAQTLLEDALHVQAIILFFFNALAIGVDVGVAGNADNRTVKRCIAAKAGIKAGKNNVFQQDVAILTHAVRHFNYAVHRRWNLNETQEVLFIGILDSAHQVQTAVAQVGEGVARINNKRRDDGGDIGAEVTFYKGALIAIECLGVCAIHAIALKCRLDASKGIFGACDHGRQGIKDAVNLLGGRHVALVVDRLMLQGGKVGQAANTHHEELNQVALKDRDKL